MAIDTSFFDQPAQSAFDDDQTIGQRLGKIMSPTPAEELVTGPPPDRAPAHQVATSTPLTGNLARGPQQAVAKNQDNPSSYTGVSSPPDGGNVRSIVSPTQPLMQRQPLQSIQQARTAAYNASPAGAALNAPVMPGSVNGTSLQPALPPRAPLQVQPDKLNMQTQNDQNRLAMLTNSGSGVSQIKNPFLRGLARVGDVAGSILAPGVAAAIPGTTLHNRQLIGQQQQIVGNDQAQQTARANQEDIAQQTAQRAATAEKETAQAGANTPRPVTADEAKAAGNPSLEGSIMRPSDIGGLNKQSVKNTGLAGVQAEKLGLKLGPDGNYIEDAENPMTQMRTITEQAKQAQSDLAQAKTELAKAGNDPRSPAYQLALRKAQTAQQNANAATTRATAYMGNYLQGAYNTGLHGDQLPGTPLISNDEGSQVGVGTKNASTAIKNQANVSQFNDVHGALDSLEDSARKLVKSGGKLNSPRVAAALAQPHGTLTQWLQGEGAKSGMTPQERDYVIANAAAHENIQAMRKAAGGTATDSSVAKLDALIPGASTPDLDYFLRQTGQIRQTANRLSTGVTTAAGGHTVHPAKPGGQLPGHEVWVRGKDGKLVKQ